MAEVEARDGERDLSLHLVPIVLVVFCGHSDLNLAGSHLLPDAGDLCEND